METLLHFLGLCPDHLQHIDILDMLKVTGQQTALIINEIKTIILIIKSKLQ